jgi:tryptophan 2-C-methyltransferase
VRVLLVNINRIKPAIAPIGLDYLADSLVAHGHQTALLDLCFSEDVESDIEAGVRGFDPQVVGISIRNTDDCYLASRTFFLPEARSIVEAVRRSTGAPVVLGGVGFSVAPAAIVAFCDADFGIVGEGESALVRLLSALSDGLHLAGVPNLVYREGKTVVRNSGEALALGDLPPRRRALVDNARYFRSGGQAGFETKRGCAMSCTYCVDPVCKGRRVRTMPPANVISELKALLAQGVDCFHTCDSEFNIPYEHARDVCNAMIESGLSEKIRWYAYCAPAPFDGELASLLKRAGCAGVDFGADSGCDDILSRLGRNFTTADLARTAAACHRHGIPFMYDLLLGGPGETRETVRATLDLVKSLDVDCVGLSIGVRVYPGTPLAELVASEGDMAGNPSLCGAKSDNPDFLKPVFYLAPEVGPDLPDYVRNLVSGDARFFLPADTSGNSNYNYNENTVLVNAIERGARGAYWEILRRMQTC